MNKYLLTLTVLALAVTMNFCKKDDPIVDDPNPTDSTSFTPPTTNYWKINDDATTGSADAFSVNMRGTDAGLSKPFNTYGYCNVHFQTIEWNSQTNAYNELRSGIAEGGFKEFYISKKQELGATGQLDSFSINLTAPEGGEYYYYVAQGGKIYISKKDGKLRFTTDGKIDMIGVKNGDMNNFAYSKRIDFSWSEE